MTTHRVPDAQLVRALHAHVPAHAPTGLHERILTEVAETPRQRSVPAIVAPLFDADTTARRRNLLIAAAQASGDVLGANGILMDAYDTDVRPLLRGLRERMGLDPDPIAAYARSGYAERIIADRVGGAHAGWGA